MGQRHQVFLIARVRPHGAPPDHPGNRRCIAAFHHQWCRGGSPLIAMRRLVTLIKQPDNAAIVRAEVRDIEGKYGSHGAVEPRIPDTPCPFTAALLAMAWSADLEDSSDIDSDGTTLVYDLLTASMGCWQGDNNDGLSILDVTDPEDPAYCFLTGNETPGTPKQRHAPLDARGYLSAYYHLEKPTKGKAKHGNTTHAKRKLGHLKYTYWSQYVEDLTDVPLLPITSLREAWPNETFRDPPRSNAVSQVAPESRQATPGDVSAGAMPTLVEISFEIVVKQSVDDGDTAEVEKLLWLPGRAAQAKTILRGLGTFTDSAAHLLGVALEELREETYRVDLTGFQMSGAHVATVLCALGDIHSVDLSGNAVIVADEVPDILAATPTLRRIVLMGCPSVDGPRLLELVQTQPSRFKTVEGILHPAFLTIDKPDPYPCAFTYVSVMSSQTRRLSCVSIPFFTPAQVVQALTDIIPWQAGSKSETMSSSDFGLPSVGTSAFQGGTRQPGQTVNERTIMTVPYQTPRIPRGQMVLWTFVRNVPHHPLYGQDQSNNGWGFVRYTFQAPSAAEAAERRLAAEKLERMKAQMELQVAAALETHGHQAAMDLRGYLEVLIAYHSISLHRPDRIDGTVYDLNGFLECMAKEGRPMPSDDAVQKLEKILYMKDELTLQDFLERMAKDGRPMPMEEAVEKFENTLHFKGGMTLKRCLERLAKDGHVMSRMEAVEKFHLDKGLYMKEMLGEYCCPLMKQETLSELDPDQTRGGMIAPLRYLKGEGFSC